MRLISFCSASFGPCPASGDGRFVRRVHRGRVGVRHLHAVLEVEPSHATRARKFEYSISRPLTRGRHSDRLRYPQIYSPIWPGSATPGARQSKDLDDGHTFQTFKLLSKIFTATVLFPLICMSLFAGLDVRTDKSLGATNYLKEIESSRLKNTKILYLQMVRPLKIPSCQLQNFKIQI